ncbi:hypothetical protein Scep_009839 [Stephania cephalantha]|uniref:Retrotransposon gag domain-containing protein n=1 Tax=Stephania cephalantha TaxID=152367 RepID=A0AAP0JTX0_9MAGN
MWWRIVLKTRPAYETWSEFLGAFRRYYFTETMVLEKQIEFDYIEQGNMSVTEYAAKFNYLFTISWHTNMSEVTKIHKFKLSLKESISTAVSTTRTVTFIEAYKAAKGFEMTEFFHRDKERQRRCIVETGQGSNSGQRWRNRKNRRKESWDKSGDSASASSAPRSYAS